MSSGVAQPAERDRFQQALRRLLHLVAEHHVEHRGAPRDRRDGVDAYLSGASSAAIDCVTVITAALVALYQVMPGRGRIAATDAMLITAPPPRWRSTGSACTAM